MSRDDVTPAAGRDSPARAGLAWRVVSSEVVSDHAVFAVRRSAVEPPDGAAARDYYTLDMPDTVTVVPRRPDGRYVLVEQYRHGVDEVVLELPAGVLRPGEEAVSGALRELEEETGHGGGRAEPLGRLFTDPATADRRMTVVAVDGCRPVGEWRPGPLEVVAVRLERLDGVRALIRAGKLRAEPSLAAWLLEEHRLAAGAG